MLNIYKAAEEDVVLVRQGALRDIVSRIFSEMDVSLEDARLATDVLVSADLRGVETHGVSNMLRHYVEGYRSGRINPQPRWRIVRETESTANIDSDRGLGVIITPKAMDIAVTKARNVGVGIVTVGNSGHLGMAAYHAMMPLKHDMIGICMTSCPPTVLPTFGSEPRLGTNPIALAAPAATEPPFVFDAATSVIPDNQVHIARRLGVKLLAGWLGDEQGTPIMEPISAPSPHRLLPLGSIRETGSHKGYGLACIVDILSGVLSLSGFGAMRERGSFSHFVAALNIDAFANTNEFKKMMDHYLRVLKDTPPAPDHDKVMVAGQQEWETEQIRSVVGIPLHKEVIEWFHDIAIELGIENNLRTND